MLRAMEEPKITDPAVSGERLPHFGQDRTERCSVDVCGVNGGKMKEVTSRD